MQAARVPQRHGGNRRLLTVALRDLRVAHGLMTFLAHPSLPRDSGGVAHDDDELGMGVRAGRDETSIMLYAGRPLAALAGRDRDLTSYATAVPGLFLTGGGTFPGAGISGAPGRNAAEVVIEALTS